MNSPVPAQPPYAQPGSTPPPFPNSGIDSPTGPPEPQGGRGRRLGVIAGVAIIAVAIGAAGSFLVSKGSRDAVRSERDVALEDNGLIQDRLDESEEQLESQSNGVADLELQVADLETSVEDLGDENAGLRTEVGDLEEAAADAAEQLVELGEISSLTEYRAYTEDWSDRFLTVETADDLQSFFFTFDRSFEQLVLINVDDEAQECKAFIANEYARLIILGSSIVGVIEFEPESLAPLQEELRAGEELGKQLYDDVCGPVPTA